MQLLIFRKLSKWNLFFLWTFQKCLCYLQRTVSKETDVRRSQRHDPYVCTRLWCRARTYSSSLVNSYVCHFHLRRRKCVTALLNMYNILVNFILAQSKGIYTILFMSMKEFVCVCMHVVLSFFVLMSTSKKFYMGIISTDISWRDELTGKWLHLQATCYATLCTKWPR